MKFDTRLPRRNVLKGLALAALFALATRALSELPSSSQSSHGAPATDSETGGKWKDFVVAMLIISILFSLFFGVKESGELRAETLTSQNTLTWPLIPIILAGISSFARIATGATKTCVPMTLNADIGGIGALVGIYVPIGLVSLSLIGGHFHTAESGTQELGVAILANLAYLTFNLFKAVLSFKRLSYADKIVAFLSVDASQAAISMTMSNKDVLAARKYIGSCIIVQALAFCVLTAALILSYVDVQVHGSCCPKQVWWAAFDGCEQPEWLIWLYMLLRFTGFACRVRLSRRLPTTLDVWKKEAEGKDEDLITQFGALPATIIGYHLEEILVVVINFATLLFALVRLESSTSSEWTDWGQSATLVTCVHGTCHWLYVCSPLLYSSYKELDNKVEAMDEARAWKLAVRAVWRCLRSLARRVKSIVRWTLSKIMPKPLSATLSKIVDRSNIAEQMQRWAEELRLASIQGDKTGVEIVLRNSNDIIEYPDKKGNTALMLAVEEGTQKHLEVVDLLLRHGASPNPQAFYLYGGTLASHYVLSEQRKPLPSPMHSAVRKSQLDFLSLLHRYSERAYSYEQFPSKQTLLQCAVERKSVSALEAILKDLPEPREPTLRSSDSSFWDILTPTLFGESTSVEVFKLLLDNFFTPADLRQRDDSGRSILQRSLEIAGDTRYDPYKLPPPAYPTLETPEPEDLEHLVEAAKCLDEAGMNLKAVDAKGRTLLHSATYTDALDLTEFLHKNILISINVTDNRGQTPLHYAVIQRPETVGMVLKFTLLLTR